MKNKIKHMISILTAAAVIAASLMIPVNAYTIGQTVTENNFTFSFACNIDIAVPADSGKARTLSVTLPSLETFGNFYYAKVVLTYDYNSSQPRPQDLDLYKWATTNTTLTPLGPVSEVTTDTSLKTATFNINYGGTTQTSGASVSGYNVNLLNNTPTKLMLYIARDPALATSSELGYPDTGLSSLGDIGLNLLEDGLSQSAKSVKPGYQGLSNLAFQFVYSGSTYDQKLTFSADQIELIREGKDFDLSLVFFPGEYDSPNAGYVKLIYTDQNSGDEYISEETDIPSEATEVEIPFDHSGLVSNDKTKVAPFITIVFVSDKDSATKEAVMGGAKITWSEASGGDPDGNGGSEDPNSDPGGDEPGANSGGETPGSNSGNGNQSTGNNYYNNYQNTNSNYNSNYNSNNIDLSGYLPQQRSNYGYGYYPAMYPRYQMPAYVWYNYGRYAPLEFDFYVKNYYEMP